MRLLRAHFKNSKSFEDAEVCADVILLCSTLIRAVFGIKVLRSPISGSGEGELLARSWHD